MDDITNADRAEWAALAIDAYQSATRSRPAPHRGDREVAEELLQDLLGDLHHYADQEGIDIAHAFDNGRSGYAEELAEEPYRIGAHVRTELRRGVVVAYAGGEGRPEEYQVRLAGGRELFTCTPDGLEACRFPAIETSDAVLQTLNEAEAHLAEVQARILVGTALGPRPTPLQLADRDTLVNRLADWGRVAHALVLDALEPDIDRHIQYLKSEHPGAVELSHVDFATASPATTVPVRNEAAPPTPAQDDRPRRGERP